MPIIYVCTRYAKKYVNARLILRRKRLFQYLFIYLFIYYLFVLGNRRRLAVQLI